ncbi:MAG: hypothetical protein LBL95_07030 [Deltaproteobacteria bacterium]|nr:hypothetical protein [Deltaproteobacteria bacterium]
MEKKLLLAEFKELGGIVNDPRGQSNASANPPRNLYVLAESAVATCPICGAPMSRSKTARRHIQTIAHRPLNVMEQHR